MNDEIKNNLESKLNTLEFLSKKNPEDIAIKDMRNFYRSLIKENYSGTVRSLLNFSGDTLEESFEETQARVGVSYNMYSDLFSAIITEDKNKQHVINEDAFKNILDTLFKKDKDGFDITTFLSLAVYNTSLTHVVEQIDKSNIQYKKKKYTPIDFLLDDIDYDIAFGDLIEESPNKKVRSSNCRIDDDDFKNAVKYLKEHYLDNFKNVRKLVPKLYRITILYNLEKSNSYLGTHYKEVIEPVIQMKNLGKVYPN